MAFHEYQCFYMLHPITELRLSLIFLLKQWLHMDYHHVYAVTKVGKTMMWGFTCLITPNEGQAMVASLQVIFFYYQ